MSKSQRVLTGLFLLVAVTSGGCLIGTSNSVKQEGVYVSEETLKKIEPGKTSESWVLATLGPPTEKTSLENRHELWKYTYKETKNSAGYVFLIFGGSDQKVTNGRVFVEIQDGVVTKSWRG